MLCAVRDGWTALLPLPLKPGRLLYGTKRSACICFCFIPCTCFGSWELWQLLDVSGLLSLWEIPRLGDV